MKNKLNYALILTLILTGCNQSTPTNLSYEDLRDKLSNNESFIFYIAQTGCNDCKKYSKSVSTYIAETNETIYKVNVTNLQLTDKITLASLVSLMFGSEVYTSYGVNETQFLTPTTVVVNNGEFDYGYIGYQDYETLKENLTSNVHKLLNYYSFRYKCTLNNSFNIVFTDEEVLSDQEVFVVSLSSLKENDYQNLLNRINYYLENNSLPTISEIKNPVQLNIQNGNVIGFSNY